MIFFPYTQLRDYLTQIISLSNTDGLPRITQSRVASELEITTSTVSGFLNKKITNPNKMMTNFMSKYPEELSKWPLNRDKIGRTLKKIDAQYFLGLQMPIQQIPRTPPLVIPPLQLIATQASTTLAQTSTPPVILPKPTKTVNTTSLIRKPHKATIAISYRGHQSDKDGMGMVFDHVRLQDITKYKTKVLVAKNVQETVSELLNSAWQNHPVPPPSHKKHSMKVTYPRLITDCGNIGLLIIPGRARAVENEPVRLAHEYRVIRNALNRGQPIIGLCAGSWRLYEQLLIWTQYSAKLNKDTAKLATLHETNITLVEVEGHNNRSGMLRLSNCQKNVGYGVKAVNNRQMHDIILNDSLLKSVLDYETDRITVNSVHWKAVNPDNLPLNTKISAVAAMNARLCKTSQEGCVEAFETEFGSPIMGIQWHPEGYNADSGHGNLFKYMAQAGSAYAAKRRMLDELREQPPTI